METVNLTILIITFQNETDIIPCLDAIPWSDLSVHVHVVDNASRDATRKRIENYCSKHLDRHIDTTRNPVNRGYAEGLNQALPDVRSPWILLLGPDVRLESGAVNTLVRFLENHPDVGCAAPQLVDEEERIRASCRRFPAIKDLLLELTGLPRVASSRFCTGWRMPDFDHRTQRDVDQPEASCLLIRREALEQVGSMDSRFPLFFNDVDWCRRFHEKGWRIVFLPDARAVHRGGASIRSLGVAAIWKSHQGFYRYFLKYAETPGERLAIYLLGWLLIITATIRSCLCLTGYGKTGHLTQNRGGASCDTHTS